jgi:plasmid stabilization system protein ParE
MATVVVTATARADLDRLIRKHSLPPSTRDRTRSTLEPLLRFPLMGRALMGRWSHLRAILGPWPWMLVVYVYDEATDVVAIVAIQDSRSAHAVTSEG